MEKNGNDRAFSILVVVVVVAVVLMLLPLLFLTTGLRELVSGLGWIDNVWAVLLVLSFWTMLVGGAAILVLWALGADQPLIKLGPGSQQSSPTPAPRKDTEEQIDEDRLGQEIHDMVAK